MKYVIYQVNFTDEEYHKINSRDPEIQPAYNAYLDATDGVIEFALAMKLYKKVAEIEAPNLEYVWQIGNIGPEDKITRFDRMHSISVGDIIVDEAGNANVVARFGFDQVDNFETQ